MLRRFPNSLKRVIIRFLEDNRGFVIVLFCLPASFLFDLSFKLWKCFYLKFCSAPEHHDENVKLVQKRVREWNGLPKENRPLMCTSRPNWLSLSTTFFRKNECFQVPIPLYHILNLDIDKMTVKVEPLVSVGEITEYLIPRGYTLEVTLEIADATCGGLAMAVGMTTYSHKVGLYQESIESYDVILADGSLVTATREAFTDLFYALPWSHGTLGFLVALELRIVPVKPYVHMEYIPVTGQKAYCDKIRELSGALNPNAKLSDYLEATVYSKDKAVIMVGNFADCDTPEKKQKINHVTRWYKPWFYKHVETFLYKKNDMEEYIPLRDYLLRHNRAIFWVLESMIPFGNHPIFRWFLGWLCPPKPAFLKFTTTPGIRAMTFVKQVFQDIVLPMTVMEDSINKAEELFDTYPVLIYPCKIYDHGKNCGQLRPPRPDQRCPNSNYGMFYDLGVYGTPGKVRRKKKYDAVAAMTSMETFIRESGGYSFLYADIFLNEEEFNEMFDLTLYNQCRRKYGAIGAFPDLYHKVRPEIDVIKIGKEYAEAD